jgi:hypothetical protein
MLYSDGFLLIHNENFPSWINKFLGVKKELEKEDFQKHYD